MKIVNIIFGLLFAYSAFIQLNDPDPFLWVVIYLYAAFISFMAVFGKLQKKFVIGGIVLFIIYAGLHLPGAIEWFSKDSKSEIFGEMSRDKLYVEETREFFGLLICVTIFALNYWVLSRKKQ